MSLKVSHAKINGVEIAFPDSVSLWNDLGPELRDSESLAVFKRSLLKLYRPPQKKFIQYI